MHKCVWSPTSSDAGGPYQQHRDYNFLGSQFTSVRKISLNTWLKRRGQVTRPLDRQLKRIHLGARHSRLVCEAW
jgi:hypothetical protein